ncbi:hypothetical protein XH84_00075 [Bradyrhizobium nanningense]|nr:hypothetical protein XH84_00075 [Bradyrhizobium nanningense]
MLYLLICVTIPVVAMEVIAMPPTIHSIPLQQGVFSSREGIRWEDGPQIGVKTSVLLSISEPLGSWQSDAVLCATH